MELQLPGCGVLLEALIPRPYLSLPAHEQVRQGEVCTYWVCTVGERVLVLWPYWC
jgi:hypothetical protein